MGKLFAKFRSTYRGIADYDILGLPEPLRVHHFYWTPEQYREDFARGGYNPGHYTPERFEKEFVSLAGQYVQWNGEPATEAMVAAIQALEASR